MSLVSLLVVLCSLPLDLVCQVAMDDVIEYIGDDAGLLFNHAYFGSGWQHVRVDNEEVNEGTLSRAEQPGWVQAAFSGT